MLAPALAIFTSAFLLFQIQPLIAKFILPWFGGGPAVWGVSMLFFQTCLVAGYAYAHLLIRFLPPRRQAFVHLALLLTALTQLPIAPSAEDLAAASSDPTLQILRVLATTIGLPFFVLSATAPLIQAWVSRSDTNSNPYRLYALSNAASLLALLSYPFVVEPLLTRQTQVLTWSLTFAVFLALCGYCAWMAGFRGPSSEEPPERAQETAVNPTNWSSWLLWLALPATAVTLLLGVTNQLTRDLVSVPFLWVLPLSVYLLSYIISFDNERWYRRDIFIPAMALCIAGLMYLLLDPGLSIPAIIAVYVISLFTLCMVCHGELNRLRPEPARLTSFYLMIAVGGALGSAFVALLMPLLSNSYLELQIGMASSVALAAALLVRRKQSDWPANLLLAARTAAILVTLSVSGYLAWFSRETEPDVLLQTRNFYGVLTVGRDWTGTADESLWLRNGSSYHGTQLTAPDLRAIPAAYYAPRSGVAVALGYKAGAERHIGMIGLGVGSIAAYGEAKDRMRIYEIDPDVAHIAATQFTFLRDTAADITVVLGDARRSLEAEPPQGFDVFVVDAFSSDAIPVHLITREAFDVYLRHLAPEGVLAILISSWHFDFAPMLHNMAREFELTPIVIETSTGDYEDWGSRWVIMTRNQKFLAQPRVRHAALRQGSADNTVRIWTDDYSSPFELLK